MQNVSKAKWKMFCSEELAIIKKCRLQLIFLSGYFPPTINVILQRKMYTRLKQKEDKKRSIFPSMFPTYMNWLIYVFLFTFKICRRVCTTMFNLPLTLHHLSYSHGRDFPSHYVSALISHYSHQWQGEVTLRLEASYMQGCSPQWPLSSWGLHVKVNLLFRLNFYHFITSWCLLIVYLWSVPIEIVVLIACPKHSQNARSGVSDSGPIWHQIPLFWQMITQQINNKSAICIF